MINIVSNYCNFIQEIIENSKKFYGSEKALFKVYKCRNFAKKYSHYSLWLDTYIAEYLITRDLNDYNKIAIAQSKYNNDTIRYETYIQEHLLKYIRLKKRNES